MIPELGQIFLVAALASALFQFLGGISPLLNKIENIETFIDRVTTFQTISLVICFALLTTSFLQDDFSVLYVASNSNTALPIGYKFAAVWGGHEGSLLLWVLILSLWTLLLSKDKALKSSPDLRIQSLSILGLISLGFLIFILYTSNPFERLFPIPLQGRGLNPLLQDPGLIIHPPFLYLGYVGSSIVFSISMAILILNNNTKEYFEILKPWIFLSWTFLSCGIGLGSWWAYYELGWGGFWFWDPVENASLLPWLTSSALLHTIIISTKKKSLQNWTLFLSIITFLLSLLGTFLVRSGVLVSVHAFANDPKRGVFILLLLLAISAISFILFLKRSKTFSNKLQINLVSREGAISLNNIFMFTLTFTILLGTVYPLFSNVIFNNKISVGAPFFNSILSPLMIPITLGMMFGP